MKFLRRLFRRRNRAAAIGIIGGADGPTSIFISGSHAEQGKREQDVFFQYAAQRITPCLRTLAQLENYLREQYGALPHSLSARQQESFKTSVILNCFGSVINRSKPLGSNPTRRQLLAYCRKDTSLQQARAYPAEKLGLEFRAYALHGEDADNDVIVAFELKSGYWTVLNDSGRTSNDLVIRQGVSEEDIRQRTPRFMAYAHALRQAGILESGPHTIS